MGKEENEIKNGRKKERKRNEINTKRKRKGMKQESKQSYNANEKRKKEIKSGTKNSFKDFEFPVPNNTSITNFISLVICYELTT